MHIRWSTLPGAAVASLLFSAGLSPASAQGPAEPAEAVCEAFATYIGEAFGRLPMRIDETTELVEIRFDCAAAVVTYVKRLLVPTMAIAAGAEERKQLQHTALHCGVDGLAAVFAMTVIDEVHAPDGTVFATLTTTPADCESLTPAGTAAATLLTPTELDAQLQAIVDVYLPNLPLRLSEDLSLMSVFHGPGALVFFYKLAAAYPPDAGPGIEARLRPTLVENDCTDEDRLLLLHSGASLTYRFRDGNDASLFTTTLTAADCRLP